MGEPHNFDDQLGMGGYSWHFLPYLPFFQNTRSSRTCSCMPIYPPVLQYVRLLTCSVLRWRQYSYPSGLFFFHRLLGQNCYLLFVKFIELNFLGASPGIIIISGIGVRRHLWLVTGFRNVVPNQVIQLLFLPIPLKAKYFVLIYGGIELFMDFGGFGSRNSSFCPCRRCNIWILINFVLATVWETKI